MTNPTENKSPLFQEISDEQAASLAGGLSFQSLEGFDFDSFFKRTRRRTRPTKPGVSASASGSGVSASLVGPGSISVSSGGSSVNLTAS